jgi:hypothetical protein
LTRVGKSRRRYLLLRSERPLTREGRATLLKRVRKFDPSSKVSRWFESYLIIRTNHLLAGEIAELLDGSVAGGSALRTVAVSGAIAKLKRLALSSSGGWAWPSISARSTSRNSKGG